MKFNKLILLTIALSVLSACVSSACKQTPTESELHQPRVGNLGGMKVSIPWYMAELLEYEGDPGWDIERWKTFKKPVRTYDSVIESFGFNLRYPDMATMETREMRIDQDNQMRKIVGNMWFRVGVNSGKYYGVAGLDGRSNAVLQPDSRYWFENYEQLPQKEFGLSLYAVKGIDPKTKLPYRQDSSAHDIYLYRERNETQTYIRCNNPPIKFTSCTQTFDLIKYGYQIKVDIYYHRNLIEHWREMQAEATRIILGFKAQ